MYNLARRNALWLYDYPRPGNKMLALMHAFPASWAGMYSNCEADLFFLLFDES